MAQRKGVYEDCRVTVAVRVRPPSKLEECERSFSVVSVKENTSVLLFESLLYKNKFPVAGAIEEGNLEHEVECNNVDIEQPSHVFTYDHVYQMNARQETVYNDLGRPLLEHCIRGFNTCLFAYGQTGSGKTYSMMGADGGRDTAHEPGIIPRLCAELFDQLTLSQREQISTLETQRSTNGGGGGGAGVASGDSDRLNSSNAVCVDIKTNNQLPKHSLSELSFHVRVNFLEIYRERVHCLVTPSSTSLRVRQHPVLGVYVEGLTDVTVHNISELLHVIREGNENRHISSTRMNEVSSRAHSIFTLHVVQRRTAVNSDGSATSMEVCSKISLVDLAGSERVHQSHINESALKETALINKSLSTLGKVINALAEMNKHEEKTTATKQHIPYRDSVLTFLLKDSLGGNSKTSMLSTISPSSMCFDETLSTLRYADRAKAIVSRAYVNESASDKRIRELEQEVARLRERIAELLKENTNEEEIVKDKQVESLVAATEKLHSVIHSKENHEISNRNNNEISADNVNIVNTHTNDGINKMEKESSGTSSLTSLELEESTIPSSSLSLHLDDESFICSEWHNECNADKLLQKVKTHANVDAIISSNIHHQITPQEWESTTHLVKDNVNTGDEDHAKYSSITIKEVKSLESKLLKSEQVMDYLKSLTPMTFIEEYEQEEQEWKENTQQDRFGSMEVKGKGKCNNNLLSVSISNENLENLGTHNTSEEQDDIVATINMSVQAQISENNDVVSANINDKNKSKETDCGVINNVNVNSIEDAEKAMENKCDKIEECESALSSPIVVNCEHDAACRENTQSQSETTVTPLELPSSHQEEMLLCDKSKTSYNSNTFNNDNNYNNNRSNDGSDSLSYYHDNKSIPFTPNLHDGRFCGRHNIIFVGHSGSGKSTIRHLLQESTRTTNSLWSRWTGGNTLPRVSPTYGISTSSVTLKSSISTMRLTLYELSGAVQYLPLMSFLPVRRSTFVICFSLTHNPSLETVRRWLEAIMCQMERACETDVILMATHADQCNLSITALFDCLREVQKEICTFVQLIQPNTLLQPRIVHFIVVDNLKRCVYAPSFRRVTNFRELLEFLSDHAFTKSCNDNTFKNGMVPIEYLALARQIKVLQTTDVLSIPFYEYMHICQLILLNVIKTATHHKQEQEQEEEKENECGNTSNVNQVRNFIREMQCCTELLSDWCLLSIMHPIKHFFHILLSEYSHTLPSELLTLSSSSSSLRTAVEKKQRCYWQQSVVINVQAFLQIVAILLTLTVKEGQELELMTEHHNNANTHESLLDKIVNIFNSNTSTELFATSLSRESKTNRLQNQAEFNKSKSTIDFDFDQDYTAISEICTDSNSCNRSMCNSKQSSSLYELFDKLQNENSENIVNCDMNELMRRGIFTKLVMKVLFQHVRWHRERIVTSKEVESVIMLLKECHFCFNSICIMHSDEMRAALHNETRSWHDEEELNLHDNTSTHHHQKYKETEQEEEKEQTVAQANFIDNTEPYILVPSLFSEFAPLPVTLHFPRYLSGPFYRINFNITPVNFFASLLSCLCNDADSKVEQVYLGPVEREYIHSITTCQDCRHFSKDVNAKESNCERSKQWKYEHNINVNYSFWKDAAWLVGTKTCGRMLIRLAHHSLLLACHFPQLHHVCGDHMGVVQNIAKCCVENSMRSNNACDESREYNIHHESIIKSSSTLLDSVMRTIDNLASQYSGVQCTKYVLCHRTCQNDDDERCAKLDKENVQITKFTETDNKTQTSFEHLHLHSDIKNVEETSEYKQLDEEDMGSLNKMLQCINNAAQSSQRKPYIPVLRFCAAPIDFTSLLQLLDEDVTLPFRTRETLRAAVSLWNKSCIDVCTSDTNIDRNNSCHSRCTKCRMQCLAADNLLDVFASLSK